MRRLPPLPIYATALATLAYVFARLVEPARPALWLDIYLLMLGAIGVFTGVFLIRLAFPPAGRSALVAALERAPREPLRPLELERLKREVALATSAAFDLHYRLRPMLREVAEQRLAARRGLQLDRGGREVEAALGPELWELVRPDQILRDNRWSPGVDRDALGRAVARLEEL